MEQQSRRAVLRAAIWSVPAVSLAATAPAHATSPPTCAPTGAFTLPDYTSANWTVATTATNGAGTAGLTFLQTSQVFTNVEPDGGPSIATVTVTTNSTYLFTTGLTYYFSVPYTYNQGNPLPILGSLLVGSTVLDPAPFANSDDTGPTTATATVSYTPTITSSEQVQIRFTIENAVAGPKILGDDMSVRVIDVATCLNVDP